MIRNIVFDMGNVILRWDPEYIASRLTDDLNEQAIIVTKLFKSKQWALLDEGKLSETEAYLQLCNEVDVNEQALLKHALTHWYDYFEPFEAMVPLIATLKQQGYGIYLLSNCSLQFDNYYQTVPAFKYFDGFYISAKHQLLKPHLAIYQDFLNTYDLAASSCLFIDDVEANVRGAQNVGMSAYRHDGDVNKLRLYLNNCLKKVENQF